MSPPGWAGATALLPDAPRAPAVAPRGAQLAGDPPRGDSPGSGHASAQSERGQERGHPALRGLTAALAGGRFEARPGFRASGPPAECQAPKTPEDGNGASVICFPSSGFERRVNERV